MFPGIPAFPIPTDLVPSGASEFERLLSGLILSRSDDVQPWYQSRLPFKVEYSESLQNIIDYHSDEKKAAIDILIGRVDALISSYREHGSTFDAWQRQIDCFEAQGVELWKAPPSWIWFFKDPKNSAMDPSGELVAEWGHRKIIQQFMDREKSSIQNQIRESSRFWGSKNR